MTEMTGATAQDLQDAAQTISHALEPMDRGVAMLRDLADRHLTPELTDTWRERILEFATELEHAIDTIGDSAEEIDFAFEAAFEAARKEDRPTE